MFCPPSLSQAMGWALPVKSGKQRLMLRTVCTASKPTVLIIGGAGCCVSCDLIFSLMLVHEERTKTHLYFLLFFSGLLIELLQTFTMTIIFLQSEPTISLNIIQGFAESSSINILMKFEGYSLLHLSQIPFCLFLPDFDPRLFPDPLTSSLLSNSRSFCFLLSSRISLFSSSTSSCCSSSSHTSSSS